MENNSTSEVILVDSNVSDYRTLIGGLDPNIPVIILPAGGDGLENIAAALADYSNLSAVHLVSHGSQGRLFLSDGVVDQSALTNQPEALKQISDVFSPAGDLLLYGCSVAAGEQGRAFVGQLSEALGGVDIAASDDRTGPLSLNGDWDLEYSEGEIESVLPFTVQGMQDIDHCLGCVSDADGSPVPNLTETVCDLAGGTHWEASDTTDPTFDAGPSTANVAATSVDLTASIDEGGTIYYVVVTNDAAVPTPREIMEGHASGGGAAIGNGSQTVSSGDFSHTFNLTGLTASTAYDIYVVAKDDEGTPNIQDSATKVEVTTAAPPNAAPTETGTFPTDITVIEDTASDLDLSGLTLADADSAGDMTLTLTATGGTLAASDNGGVVIGGTDTNTLALTGTISEIDTYLNTSTFIKYTSALNENGSDAQTVAVKINDGDGSGDVSLGTFNLDITAVNDDPTETGTFPTDVTVIEDTASDLDLSGLTLADVDSTGDLTLTLTATGGTLAASDNGGVVISGTGTSTLTLTGTISEIDTYLNTSTFIKYTSALNESGADAQTVAVKVNDGEGSGDVSLGTFNLDITAVNDAPVLSGAPTLAQFEDAAAVAMDLSGVTLADVDTTGDITISIGVADTSAALSATATGTINNVDVTQVNAYTITLAGTVSELNTYLGNEGATNITYATSTNNDNNDTLSIVANDGNSNSNSLTPVITITGINDEPTASATGDNSSAAGAGSAVSVFSSTAISAVDIGENIASVTFTVSGLVDTSNEKMIIDGSTVDLMTTVGSTNATGTNIAYAVTYSAGTATVVITGNGAASAANTVFQTALNGMTYENTLGAVTTGDRVFTLTEVKDEGGIANSGDDTLAVTIASTITVVNGDTPTATNATKAATEDTPFTMTTSEIVLVQEANSVEALEFITLGTITGGALAFTGAATTSGTSSSAGSGTVTLVDAAAALTTGQHIHVDNIANIQFTPTADSTTPGSVLYTVTDAGGDASGSATLTINLAAVEDAPTLTGVTTTITALEDTATNLITGSPVFDDVDTTADVVATLTAADGASVLTSADASGVVVGNSGTNAITLTGTASEINTFLGTPANVTYTGSTNNVASDSVVISVDDGETGTDTNATTITISFTPINDEPVVSATGTGGTSTNGAAKDLFDSTTINVAVPDTGDLVTSVTFTVSGLQDGADEKINIDGAVITLTNGASNTTAGNSLTYAVSVTGSTATVVLTHAGIAEATVETVLDAMTYENTAGSFTEGDRVITITEVKDDGGTANSGDDTWSTGVTSTVTVVDGTKPAATSYTDSVSEDTAVSLSATELPTAQDVGPVDALEYITIDTSTVVGGVVSLDSAGTAGTSTIGAIAYDITAGDLTGTVNINILDIGKLDFTPTANLAGAGAGSFNWTVTDAGGHTSPAATYTLDITNTPDDPAGADKSISITTGATHTFSASDFGFTDPDSGDALNRVQVNVQTIDNGALKLSNVAVSDGDWINLADIGNLVYTPSATGADTFTFTVEDDSTNATDSTPNTLTINVSAPPSSSGGGALTPTPTPDTETIDGAVVTTTEETDNNGNALSVITIAPVAQGREDSDATTSQADVPLHFADDAGTDVVTTISLPTGIGLAARANDTAHSRNTLDDLINLINETAGDTDSNRDDMVNSGESFLETLGGSDSTLWVNQVTLTSTGTTASDTPIKVTGSVSSSQNNFQEALVIDTRQLPTGSRLELDDIEFAVIVGDGVTIRGGAGANTVFAGEGSQDIVLGADDDQLHGGSGDDIVGSEGGDDLLFGDAGNDTMFGGEGNDQLHGGLDTDIATYEGSRADYDVVQEYGVVTVSRKDDPTDTDTLINIEQVQFGDQSIAPVYNQSLQMVATLYHQVLGRQADLGGFQHWSASDETQSIGQIALDFLTSDEYQQNQNIRFEQLTQADQVEQLYLGLLNRSSDAEGKAFWLNVLSNGTSMEQVTESFVTSAELSPQYLEANSWSFIV